MTKEEIAEAENTSAARLAALFSACPTASDGVHCWNFTKRECKYCGAPFPYPNDDS